MLRNDTTGLYFDFIEYFLSAVIGKTYYKENRCEKLLSEYASVSDEALAILIFENNFETWRDMAKQNITKNSVVTRKYTNGGSATGNKASSRHYQGWSTDGIKRFNELFDLIKNDRDSPNAKNYEESFRVFCENGGVSGKKKKSTEIMYEPVEIRHELWSDDIDNDTEGEEEQKGKRQKVSGDYDHNTNISISNDGILENEEDEDSNEPDDEDESPIPYTNESKFIRTKKYSV